MGRASYRDSSDDVSLPQPLGYVAVLAACCFFGRWLWRYVQTTEP